MLSLVSQGYPEQIGEARELLRLVELGRSNVWAVAAAALLLLAACAFVAGVGPVAGLLIGVSVSLSLCHYGPHWWPGRR